MTVIDLTKHTKGPWQVSGARVLSPEYKGHGVGPDGEDYVVIVPYNSNDHKECLANAHLLAAAPMLLKENEIYAEGVLAAYDLLGNSAAVEHGNKGMGRAQLKKIEEKVRKAVVLARQRNR